MMMKNGWRFKMIRWRSQAISLVEIVIQLVKSIVSERQFIYIAAVLIAVTCAAAVIFLKSFAHLVFNVATWTMDYLKLPYAHTILPLIGILLTVWVIRYFLGGTIEKGSSRILYAIAKKGGSLPKKQMHSQIWTSALTVGMGGSAGLESPITITGAAIGSNFAKRYQLTQKERLLLLACGVAAGIGAAFNAPIAGVLFAIEVVLIDVATSAFVPIIISAATGSLVSHVVLNEGVLLHFPSQQEFHYQNTLYYIVLGVICGYIAVYHARWFHKVEKRIGRITERGYRRALIGGSLLGLLLFFYPTLFGEGYNAIHILSNDRSAELLNHTVFEVFKNDAWLVWLIVGATIFIKAFATGLTLGAGGNGGNFAPSLFIGAFTGFTFAKFFELIGFSQLPIGNFTLVGMAGILAGLFHAPLTAIFLIGEITGGYELMVPLMIVASISYAVSKRIDTHSFEVKQLAQKGEAFTEDKDRNILQSIALLTIMQTNIRSVRWNAPMDEVLDIMRRTEQAVIPVLNDQNALVGLIEIPKVRAQLMQTNSPSALNIPDLMTRDFPKISIHSRADIALQEMERMGWNYITLFDGQDYAGIVSKVVILETYRAVNIQMHID